MTLLGTFLAPSPTANRPCPLRPPLLALRWKLPSEPKLLAAPGFGTDGMPASGDAQVTCLYHSASPYHDHTWRTSIQHLGNILAAPRPGTWGLTDPSDGTKVRRGPGGSDINWRLRPLALADGDCFSRCCRAEEEVATVARSVGHGAQVAHGGAEALARDWFAKFPARSRPSGC
jgi:hypothetical protein